jgi:hypothetical protein
MVVPAELTIPLSGCSTTPVLRQVLEDHLEPFVERVEESEGNPRVPSFVLRELRAMRDCSDFTRGFWRLRCDACKADRVVPFTCHARLCPCCAGRMMADRAAHLADRGLPHAPFRQWVQTFPSELARHLAFDADLAAAVIRVFIRIIFDWQCARAAATATAPPGSAAHPGAMVWIQRFSDGAGIYFHLHALVPDGIFREREGSLAMDFVRLPPPTDGDIASLVRRFATRTAGLLTRRLRRSASHHSATDESGATANSTPEAAGMFLHRCAQSLARTIAEPAGPPAANRRLLRRRSKPLCARHADFELHAAVRVSTDDRSGLERLCRYLARPALASGRLRRLPDGRIELQLKRVWRGGVRKLLFEPDALIARLCALVPPPRFHLIRAFGILSNASALRPYILPTLPDSKHRGVPTAPPRPAQMRWADLMLRTFRRDVTVCPCGGRLRMLAAITQPNVAEAIAAAIILSSQRRARPPPRPPRPVPPTR